VTEDLRGLERRASAQSDAKLDVPAKAVEGEIGRGDEQVIVALLVLRVGEVAKEAELRLTGGSDQERAIDSNALVFTRVSPIEGNSPPQRSRQGIGRASSGWRA
jgi:hypothetical protein